MEWIGKLTKMATEWVIYCTKSKITFATIFGIKFVVEDLNGVENFLLHSSVIIFLVTFFYFVVLIASEVNESYKYAVQFVDIQNIKKKKSMKNKI